MRVSLEEVGRRGRLSLTFGLQDGKTILRDSYCEVPFKITHLLGQGTGRPQMILMQCTAGLFGGDDLECDIRVKSGARVRITQQSATRIHPSRGRQAVQRSQIFVESGASLQLYLEPIIPFADSRLNQSTRIEVEAGGRLAYWEAFMTGRVGSGESWQFRELASETQLHSAGRLIYLDRFRICAGDAQNSRWAMGTASYLGTGLYLDPQSRYFASAMHELLPESGIDSVTDSLTTVRVVSADGPEFHRSGDLFRAQAATMETHALASP